AAKLPGISQGAGVTAVSWLLRVGFLATSPIIGLIANAAGLRWALGLLVLVGAATAVFARALPSTRR
ncbi:MAG: MFS transporter, partial [Leucobacter sp.]